MRTLGEASNPYGGFDLLPRRGRLGHGRLTISAASANVMLLVCYLSPKWTG
jgi:hypothetical protein